MLFQGFIHSAFLWGTLLAAVPLVIHLFNRQRHKPMRWAAMEFVLAAYRKTRRRAQLENLLLLLLRMAAVALLALAIARPFTGDDSPLAPLTESRRDLALILDASASTGYRESIQSVHEGIVERAAKLLEERDGRRGDRVRLYVAGAHPRLVSARSPEDALALLAALEEPTAERLDLAAVLAEVAEFAEKAAGGTGQGAVEVRLLTDLQRNAFDAHWERPDAGTGADDAEEEDAEGASVGVDPLRAALDRLQALDVPVWVEDLGAGSATPPNVGVVSVAPLGEVHGAGMTTEIAVRVRNHGPKSRPALRLALAVDGERQQVKKLDVDARSTTEAVFQVVFASPGAHTLEASLEGDRLGVDDRRAAVVVVPAPIRVLLVDGDPHPEVDRDEVGYLRAVLEPVLDDDVGPGSVHTPFLTTVVTAIQFGFGELDLDGFDLIVLANVGSLSARAVEELEARVGAGAALLVTLGDKTADRGAIESLNARLWSADGTGLLPARLFLRQTARQDAYYRCLDFDEEHPALRFFADERWRPFLTEVPIFSFVACEDHDPASVLASLDDEGQHPLLLERPYRHGRVFLWTTSIDTGWNRVADSPSTLIPLVHELFRYATRGTPAPRNVPVGGAFTVDVRQFPRDARVHPPGVADRPLDGAPTEVVEGVWRLPPVLQLEAPGLWRVSWEGGEEPFAVCIDGEEGNLDRLAPAELEAHHPAWRLTGGEVADEREDDGSRRGELWRWLAALALAMLVGETLWGAWIEHQRRLA